MRMGSRHSIGLGVALAGALFACVEPYGGAALLGTFAAGVQIPTGSLQENPPTPPQASGRPPAHTYYAFWAAQYVYQRDEAGAVVRDVSGNPVVSESYIYHVQDFEIRPLIDRDSPCFIELDEDRFPGLHVTQIYEKMREVTGITDPLNAPPGTPEADVIDVLTAQARVATLRALDTQVKAVVSFSNALPPGIDPGFPLGTSCLADNPAASPGEIPPPPCRDEASNQRRLALCTQYWEKHESYYEGSDKVYTLPLNGRWHGAVNGINPKSQAPLGGINFFPPVALDDFDSLMIHWQYKDRDGDGEPDYPDPTMPALEKSRIGFHYMEGLPVRKTRGVVNVPMKHRVYSPIHGEAAIFSNLAVDEVHF